MQCSDDAFPDNARKLFAADPIERAKQRISIDQICKKMIKPFYQILQFQDEHKEEREEAVKNYFAELSSFVEKMDADGPFFNGQSASAVDFVSLPWATRMFLLKHYRGIEYEQCFVSKETLRRYEQWYKACSSLDAVVATQQSPGMAHSEYSQELIKKYKRYATNTAKTMVADAVNKGTAMP